jgi:2-oxoacid:acceptor oxidoreductase gamma subunit (pyruvate/2-ketoisovalerate family)
VVAFTRVSDHEIRERYGIYEPDCLVILDSSLTRRKGITEGLKEGHWIIINSDKRPEDYLFLGPYRVATLDANTIAQKFGLGSVAVPIVNTTILGAFSKATQTVAIKSIMDAVRENVPSKPERNAEAALEAYEKVVL